MAAVPRDGLEPVLTADLLQRFGDAYLGGEERGHPSVSPLLADLTGLPPLVIDAAGNDTLRGQARRLADRAQEAGLNVHYREHRNLSHGFHSAAGLLKQADQALDHVAAELLAAHAKQSPAAGSRDGA